MNLEALHEACAGTLGAKCVVRVKIPFFGARSCTAVLAGWPLVQPSIPC